MSMKKMLRAAMALMFIFSVAGCGSDGDSETNGNLTLSAAGSTNAAAKTVTLTATAVLTPAMAGSEITFTTLLFNNNGALPLPAGCSDTRSTNPAGSAPFSCNFAQPDTAATLQVSASSGGLAALPVTIAIPGAL